jgi:hypothetical protein
MDEPDDLAALLQEPRFGIGMRTGAEFDFRPGIAARGFLAVRYNKSCDK